MLPDPAGAGIKDVGKYVALFVSLVQLGSSYQLYLHNRTLYFSQV